MPGPDAIATDLTGTQKAAILLMVIGEEAAASILRNLGPGEVQHLGAAMYSVSSSDQQTIDAVLEEFLVVLSEETGLGFGRGAYIRKVLNRALGEDKAQSVLSRITPAAASRPIAILDWMDATSIAEMLADEHPQIAALTLASLEPQAGAEVLALMPEDDQPDLIRRIATLNTVPPEALAELERVMDLKFRASTSSRASQLGGVRSAARIMNFTRPVLEQRVLKGIGKDDKGLMQAISENMFVFDNLIKSDDRALQTLLRAVDTGRLVVALKGADEDLRERLLGCLSTRAAANVRDEMQAMGPIRLTDVLEAQREIVAQARRMADAGTIVLGGRGGEKLV